MSFVGEKGEPRSKYCEFALRTLSLHRINVSFSLMWGLQRSTSVIPKCVTPERIASNFDLAGWSLSPEEHATLSSLEERCRVYPDDWLPGRAFWDEDN